ncbi:F0F1 ATP synthase subunit delta [Candidatus Nomurabacteria bacterium]|nr:F0F1 ATP synthase subunit delta [Candidatus Nomurabacteria bacterium]
MAKISIKNLAETLENMTECKNVKELEMLGKNFAIFLKNKKLLSQSEEILKELQKVIDRKKGIVRMKVKTAKVLTEEKKKSLEHEMKERYGSKHIESEYFEDKNLLGGMKIQVGEDVLDMTYRNNLKQLEKHLINK